jgi:hypothetical protein
MLKTFPLLLASLLFAAGAVYGQSTYTVDALATQYLIESSSGTALAAGDVIRLGYFPSSDLSIVETSQSYATLNSIFTPYGEGTLPTTTGTLNESGGTSPVGNANTMYVDNASSTTGAFTGTFLGISSTYIPSGDLLYMWVFNSSNPTSATQWGIFYDPTSTEWEAPPAGSFNIVSTSDPGVTALQGTGTSNSQSNFELVTVVPEPGGTSLLAGGMACLAALGGIALRRRRLAS